AVSVSLANLILPAAAAALTRSRAASASLGTRFAIILPFTSHDQNGLSAGYDAPPINLSTDERRCAFDAEPRAAPGGFTARRCLSELPALVPEVVPETIEHPLAPCAGPTVTTLAIAALSHVLTPVQWALRALLLFSTSWWTRTARAGEPLSHYQWMTM